MTQPTTAPPALLAKFRALTGREATLGARAPGRVNLIGDHVDYADGIVLPLAIDRSCLVVGAFGGEPGAIRITSTARDDTVTLPAAEVIEPGRSAPRGDWSSYPVGTIGVMLAGEAPRALDGLDLLIESTVPAGSGLSSSAALELATGLVIGQALGIEHEPLALAELCRRAEHEYAGVPCGLMDQAASALGRGGFLVRFDCRDLSWAHVPAPEPDAGRLLVVDTGVRHAHAAGEYAARRGAAIGAARSLGLASLRDLAVADAERAARGLGDDERAACLHIPAEIARATETAGALEHADLERVGRLMFASHRSLRDTYRVSCAELDSIVDEAGDMPGVLGARMTGGGFGGCALLLVRPSDLGAVAARLAGVPGASAWEVWAGDGASRLRT